MLKKLLLLLLFSLTILAYQAQNTFFSVQNGDWDDASTWALAAGPGGVEGVDFPAGSDSVIINHDVLITATNSGADFVFTGYLRINSSHELRCTVGNSTDGFQLTGNGVMHVYGSFYTAEVGDEPTTNNPDPIEFFTNGNSQFIAFTGSFLFVSDDWEIQGNSVIYIDNNVCLRVDDDVNFNGTGWFMCGNGDISIGGDGAGSTVSFGGGSSNAQICSGTSIIRNTVSTDCSTGTTITTGTGPSGAAPTAVDDNVQTQINTSIAVNVLYLGIDDNDIALDTLSITSAGSNGAATNNTSAQGGVLVLNDNGSPLNFTDDFIVYSPPIGFSGFDSFDYIITDEEALTDRATVTIFVTGCGVGFVADTTFVPIASVSDNIGTGVDSEANLLGAPNGTVANWYDGGDIINVDFGQSFTSGTQYLITWKLRTGTNPAQPVIRESLTNGAFVALNNVYTITSSSIQQTVITSERDFRFLQITKDNAVDDTDFEIDAIQVLDINCLSDVDNDGIPNTIDIDDDNDGVLDIAEELSCRGFLNFEFYDGTPSGGTVDNIPTTGALATGTTTNFDVDQIQNASDPGDTDNYGIRFTGFITIATSETYTFYTTSDDGSKLFIGATEVVDNDGNHSVAEESGTISLTPGSYPITVLYFENTGDDILSVAYSSASISKRVIPFSALSVAGTGCDTDNDGIINAFDLDSDNDGIADIIEAGGVDVDNNGVVDVFSDTDNDGYANTFDSDNGGVALADLDIDLDGLNNRVDIDSDNDGIVDVIEAQLSGSTPQLPSGIDSDNDGIDDEFDTNSGNTLLIPINTDGFDSPDYIDTDSDNDQYDDLLEAYDTDNDGALDISPSGLDTDLDGLDDNFDLINGQNSSTNVSNNGQTSNSFPNLDQVTTTERDWREFLDTDGDGISDFSDIDTDNDGILNVDENTSCLSTGSGRINYEFYDAVPSGFKFANIPTTGALSVGTISTFNVNTLQGLADPGDADVYSIRYTGFISINTNETYTFFTTSDDGSGLFINGNLIVDNDDLHGNRERSGSIALSPGVYEITVVFFENFGGANLTVSYQTPTISKRQIPFSVLSDANFCDADNDGIQNHLDLDSDNDGIPDIIEAGGLDSDNDGRVDDDSNSDNDGWADLFDSDNGGTSLADNDNDGDGIKNRVDLDSDNDGIADVIEAGGTDSNNDGEQEGPDANFNGWSDLIDGNNGGTALTVADTDGDSFPNYLDIDSDNDGITDNVEGQSTLAFLAPTGVDTDNDGWDNRYDSDNGGTAITLNNQESNGNPDYIDLDTDGDGQPDWIEGFDDDQAGAAQDGDALNDFLARSTNFVTNGGAASFYNNSLDTDSDGIPNWLEDQDLDGQPNFLDPDSPFYHDSNNNGLIDLFDANNFGSPSLLPNKDGDGEPDWRDIDNTTTLPITLLSFNAEKNVLEVLLTWTTVSEINNDYFTVERSKDGINFTEVGSVEGAGNTNTKRDYRLVDNTPYHGTSYYRLKQTDFNGMFTYSELRTVNYSSSSLVNNSTIYPNPNDGKLLFLNVYSEIGGLLELQIRSLEGQLINQHEIILDGKVSNYTIELLTGEELASGMYMVTYILDKEVLGNKRFVVK